MADPDQPRKDFDSDELSELKSSIESRGIKQPISVRWDLNRDRYVIIDGERRFRAATLLKLAELPCIIHRADDKETLIDQIVHNWQRSALRPIETSDALARLRDEFGLNNKQLSEVTGKKKSDISKLLAIHDRVSPEIQDVASQPESKLSRRHLYTLSKLQPADQQQLASDIDAQKLTAAQVEKRVAKESPKSNRIRIHKPQGTAARQRRFSTSLADVTITMRRGAPTDDAVSEVLSQVICQISAAA